LNSHLAAYARDLDLDRWYTLDNNPDSCLRRNALFRNNWILLLSKATFKSSFEGGVRRLADGGSCAVYKLRNRTTSLWSHTSVRSVSLRREICFFYVI